MKRVAEILTILAVLLGGDIAEAEPEPGKVETLVISLHNLRDGDRFTGGLKRIVYEVRTPANVAVDRIDVLIEGQPAGTPRGFERADEVTVKPDVTAGQVVVALPGRDVTVSLVAHAGDRVSAPATVKLAWAGPRVGPKLYAVVIGVSRYDDQSFALQYAAKDATDFAAALEKQNGGLFAGVEVKVFTDSEATRKNIVKGLQWLKSQVTSHDLGIVYVAGHGWTDEVGNFWFLPVNATPDDLDLAVAKDDLLRPMEAMAGKAVLFIDACHAASTGKKAQLQASARGSADMDSLIRDFGAADRGIVTFASSQGREVSLERRDWGNGAFTKALVEGLGEGKAAARESGRITLSGLSYYVANRVKELTGGVQHPVMNQNNVPDFPIGFVSIFNGDTTIILNPPVSEAQAAYDAAARIGTRLAYQSIIDSYPSTIHAKLAAAAIAALPPEVVALPPSLPPSEPSAPSHPALPPSPGGEARKITLADLPADAEARLREVVRVTGPAYEITYGYFRDHLYVAVLTWGLSWQGAKRVAERAGGHLVTIGSEAENKFVADLFVDDYRFIEPMSEGQQLGPWIGLFQAPGSREPAGGWQWVTGEPLTFKKWSSGQPNNYAGKAHFGAFHTFNDAGKTPVRWDDHDANGVRGFVMEVDPAAAKAELKPR